MSPQRRTHTRAPSNMVILLCALLCVLMSHTHQVGMRACAREVGMSAIQSASVERSLEENLAAERRALLTALHHSGGKSVRELAAGLCILGGCLLSLVLQQWRCLLVSYVCTGVCVEVACTWQCQTRDMQSRLCHTVAAVAFFSSCSCVPSDAFSLAACRTYPTVPCPIMHATLSLCCVVLSPSAAV